MYNSYTMFIFYTHWLLFLGCNDCVHWDDLNFKSSSWSHFATVNVCPLFKASSLNHIRKQNMLCKNYSDDVKKNINMLGFGSSLRLWNWAHTVVLIFWISQQLAILCCVLRTPLYIILFMLKSPSLFIKTRLFLFYSFPSSQILPVKNTGEKMRGRNGGEQNLSEEKGPLSEPPFPCKECAQRWRKMKEVKKKNCSLYFLKIDFSFTPRGRLTGRQVGVWIEGGRELKEEGRLFQTQKQMKEVFWQSRQTVWWRHALYSLHVRTI